MSFYQYYDNIENLIENYMYNQQIENIICTDQLVLKTVTPGQSHFRNLWEYPEKKDIIEFLIN